jgi:3-dehydroquinate dehydratase-1
MLYKEIADLIKIRPLICTSIPDDNEEDFLQNVKIAKEGGSDIAELRLDFFNSLDGLNFDNLMLKSVLPLIVTNRNKENGGLFSGDENSRLFILKKCISAKPLYVDIELNMQESSRDEIINYAKKQGVNVICSYHDFNGTPKVDSILSTYDRAVNTDCDLIKMVYTPKNNDDSIRILEAVSYIRNYKNKPFTLFGMGKYGQLTRTLSLFLGSSLTYCAINSNPGNRLYQLSLEDTMSAISYIESEGLDKMKKNEKLFFEMLKIELKKNPDLASIDKIYRYK